MDRRLDFSPLTGKVGVIDRLRTAGGNNLNVASLTVGVLLVGIPAVVLVRLLATGWVIDWGAVVFMLMLMGAGAYTIFGILWGAKTGTALERFADRNGLDVTRGTMALHYAGSEFATSASSVFQSVRTRQPEFVEIGDRFPTRPDRNGPNTPQLFLRTRLAGRVLRQPYPGELVTGSLDAALRRFAGGYRIEVSGDELTLFGNEPLGAQPDRVGDAFAFADTLTAAANATLVPHPDQRGAVLWTRPGPNDPPAPAARRGGVVRPLVVVVGMIGLLAFGSVAIALVFSIADDYTRGNAITSELLAQAVVLAVMVVIGGFLKLVLTPRRGKKKHASSTPHESRSPRP